jgi:hypothetical protein
MGGLNDSEIARTFARAEVLAEEWDFPANSALASLNDVDAYQMSLEEEKKQMQKEEEPKTSPPEPEDTDDAGVLDQDNIAALVNSINQENGSSKPEEKPAPEPAPEPDDNTMMGQDDIAALIAQTQQENAKEETKEAVAPAKEEPPAKPAAKESDDDDAMLGQDAIAALIAETQSKQAVQSASEDEPELNLPTKEDIKPEKEEDSDDNAMMGQDDIEALLAETKAEKAAEPTEPAPSEPIAETKSSPSDDEQMSQDDIAALLAEVQPVSQKESEPEEESTPAPSAVDEDDDDDDAMLDQDDIASLIAETQASTQKAIEAQEQETQPTPAISEEEDDDDALMDADDIESLISEASGEKAAPVEPKKDVESLMQEALAIAAKETHTDLPSPQAAAESTEDLSALFTESTTVKQVEPQQQAPVSEELPHAQPVISQEGLEKLLAAQMGQDGGQSEDGLLDADRLEQILQQEPKPTPTPHTAPNQNHQSSRPFPETQFPQGQEQYLQAHGQGRQKTSKWKTYLPYAAIILIGALLSYYASALTGKNKEIANTWTWKPIKSGKHLILTRFVWRNSMNTEVYGTISQFEDTRLNSDVNRKMQSEIKRHYNEHYFYQPRGKGRTGPYLNQGKITSKIFWHDYYFPKNKKDEQQVPEFYIKRTLLIDRPGGMLKFDFLTEAKDFKYVTDPKSPSWTALKTSFREAFNQTLPEEGTKITAPSESGFKKELRKLMKRANI